MHACTLHSTLGRDGHLRLTLDTAELAEPATHEVIVRVDAAPVNPTDLYLMLSMADLSRATVEGDALVAPVPPAAVTMAAARIDAPLIVGSEGAGTVVAAGAGARSLLGKIVAFNGGSFATHRVLPAAAVRELPPGRTARDGASSFVNPMTALSFVETMRAEGHTAIVHTAAASALGQMLIKICAADGVPLVNVVRRPAQVETLRALGAEHVVDSSAPSFDDDLVRSIGATGATLAFDAIGGGAVASQLLSAMERVAARDMAQYSHTRDCIHPRLVRAAPSPRALRDVARRARRRLARLLPLFGIPNPRRRHGANQFEGNRVRIELLVRQPSFGHRTTSFAPSEEVVR